MNLENSTPLFVHPKIRLNLFKLKADHVDESQNFTCPTFHLSILKKYAQNVKELNTQAIKTQLSALSAS